MMEWSPKDGSIDTIVMKQFLEKIQGINLEHPRFIKENCTLWHGAGANRKSDAYSDSIKGRKHGAFRCNGTLVVASRFMYQITYGIPENAIPNQQECPCESGKVYQSCCRPEIRHPRISQSPVLSTRQSF